MTANVKINQFEPLESLQRTFTPENLIREFINFFSGWRYWATYGSLLRLRFEDGLICPDRVGTCAGLSAEIERHCATFNLTIVQTSMGQFWVIEDGLAQDMFGGSK